MAGSRKEMYQVLEAIVEVHPSPWTLPLSWYMKMKKIGEVAKMTSVTLCPTKAGNGYKVVVDGVWFYTSIKELHKMLKGEAHAVKFRTIDEYKRMEVI